MLRLCLLSLLLTALCVGCLAAEADSLSRRATTDTLRVEMELSPSFLRALDAAFSLSPVATPPPRTDELTTEQLHQWVGSDAADAPVADTTATRRKKYTREYFRYKCYLDELGTVTGAGYVKIAGLNDGSLAGKGPASARVLGTFDVNHGLSMLFSPSYRRVQKMRRLADEHRAEMDAAFPLEGDEPLRPTKAADRLWERPDWLK